MDLRPYSNKAIRVYTEDGDCFEGLAELFPAEYGFLVFEREEESLKLGTYHIFESEILSITQIPEERLCPFFGAEYVPEEIRELYRALCRGAAGDLPWRSLDRVCAEIVKQRFGGEVLAVDLYEGGSHCFNEREDHRFDLCSEVFGEDEPEYLGLDDISPAAALTEEEKEILTRLEELLRAFEEREG